jgi:uncharacterized Zn finger protein
MVKSSQSFKSSPEKIRERAEELVREGGITHQGNGIYIVPAQGNGKFSYKVNLNQGTCECKYYETHHEKCKHIVAAEIVAGVEDKKEEEEEINLEEVYEVSTERVQNLSPECVALLLQSLARKVVELESKVEELLREKEEKEREENKRLLDKLCGID